MGQLKTQIPSIWYFDEAVHEAERKNIFAANWAFFGPLHDVAQAGSYKAGTVNGWAIVVTRTMSGDLRAFHNVCRHRGAKVMPDGKGRCKLMVCPYHSWGYDLDGALRNARNFGDDAGLDFSEHSLMTIAVDVWQGLIFVRIATEGPSLSDWLGDLPDHFEPFPGPDDLEFYDGFHIDGNQNWKLFCENTLEGYHLPSVHQRLNRLVDSERSTIESYNDGRLVIFHVTYVSEGTDLRGSTGIWWYLYPGFQGVGGDKAFKAERIEPMGARNVRYTDWTWVSSELPDPDRVDAFEWSKEIVHEDLGPCQTIQLNMEAGIYEGGPLSPTQETHISGFQKLVLKDLQDQV